MANEVIIGVDFDGRNARIGRVRNQLIEEEIVASFPRSVSQTKIINTLERAIDKVFDDEVAGIGVGVPGIIDVRNGIVLDLGRIKNFEKMPVKAKLEKKFHIPVYVNNDANCFVTGEKYFGKGQKYKDVIGLIVGAGFGAGIILDGVLHSGTNSAAGEIGRIPYKVENFEHYCSSKFFTEYHAENYISMIKSAENKKDGALKAFRQYGNNLGDAIISLIYMYDPQIIVIGGPVSQAYPFFYDSMMKKIKGSIDSEYIAKLIIENSSLPNISVLGAAALYYEALQADERQNASKIKTKMESDLEESRQKYFRLFNQILDPIFIFDKKSYRFLDCNENVVKRVYGYNKDELKNMTPFDLHPPEDIPKVKKRIKIKNIDVPFTYTHMTKKGKRFNVEILSDEVIYDGQAASISIVRDISDRLKIEAELKRRARQAALIYEIGKRVSGQLKLESLLAEIVESICDAFNYFGVMLLLVDDHKKVLNLLSIAGGYKGVFPTNMSIKISEGMIGLAARSRKIQVAGDVTKDPNYVKKAEEVTCSELAAPIISGNKVIGVLDMQSDQKYAFDKTDAEVAGTLCSQIAIAIENARHYRQAQQELEERRLMEKKLRSSKNGLQRAKRETDSILQNVEEGLFIINSGHKISSQYSTALKEILQEDDLAGLNILNLLRKKEAPADALEPFKEYLQFMFKIDMDEESINQLNPLNKVKLNISGKQGQSKQFKYLTFNFRRIIDNNKISGLIATVTDITSQVELENKLKESETQSKKQMEWLFNIMHVEPELIQEFIESSEQEINSVCSMLKIGGPQDSYPAILEKIYRSIHLIKGNASLLDLNFFANIAHQCEDSISSMQKAGQICAEDFVALDFKVGEMNDSIVEIKKLIERISQIHNHFRPKRSYESEKLLNSIDNFIHNLGKDLEKHVEFNYEGFDGMSLPHRYKLLVKDILIQFARNSVYHGIEEEREREVLGKTAVAQIKLSSEVTSDAFCFTFYDDGRGLQMKKLYRAACKSGRWKKNEIDKWADEDLARIIFESGISTSESADVMAGRGVGMNLIRERVHKYNGKISMASKEGKYCKFTVSLPLQTESSDFSKKSKGAEKTVGKLTEEV